MVIYRDSTPREENNVSAKRDKLVVGLDVGTTKICAIVGCVTEDGVDIVGVGTAPSKGLRKGVVVNIDETVRSIKKAVSEAELMAGCSISSVYVGIAGSHIKSFNSKGVVAIKHHEVSHDDVRRAMDSAKAINMPQDREIIHMIPQEFVIDGQDGIREPLGMSGVRLEAEVHIVTAQVTSAQNIVKSCNRAGLDVADVVLEQIASSESCLNADERELGVCLIDIGGGTTDIAVFVNGSIQYTSTLPLGGAHLTNDISVGLRTSLSEADRLKRIHGTCLTSRCSSEEMIDIPAVGGRKPHRMPREKLAEILELRVEELFGLVKAELIKFNCLGSIPTGIVLTGGTTLLDGMPEHAEQIFDMPVRRVWPRNVGGLYESVASPMYSTGVGLVQYGVKNNDISREISSASAPLANGNLFGTLVKKMKGWFGDLF